MRTPRQWAFYLIMPRTQSVHGIFWEGGRRRLRRLCSFAEAHIAPDGSPLPDWSAEQRDSYLARLWRGAHEQIAPAGAAHPALLFSALSEEWLRDIKARRSPNTHRLYRYGCSLWLRMMRDGPVDGIRRAHLRDFTQRLLRAGKSIATINVYLAGLRAFLRWAEDELQDRGIDFRAPRVRLEPAPTRAMAPTPDDALRRAWKVLTARINSGIQSGRTHSSHFHGAANLRRLLVLLASTAARAGELIHRRASDLDAIARGIWVRAPKERRDKFLPLTDPVWNFLMRDLALTPGTDWLFPAAPSAKRPAGSPMWPDANSAGAAAARLWRRLGYAQRPWKRLHGLRRRAITRMVDGIGASYEEAALVAGHRQVSRTRGYVTSESQRKRRLLMRAALDAPFRLGAEADGDNADQVRTGQDT